MMLTKLSICLAMIATICAAQNKEEAGQKYDRLDFVLKEVDGSRVVNSRAYSAIIELAPPGDHTPNHASIRAGSRIPVPLSPGTTGQWQNVDVGVSIDTVNCHEVPAGLALHVSAELNDIAPSEESTGATPKMPITRQMKWSSDVIVPLRKPTTIFSSDDPTSKHKMQLEVTATPIF